MRALVTPTGWNGNSYFMDYLCIFSTGIPSIVLLVNCLRYSRQDNEVRFLICTDVAARGIDIKGVPYGMLFDCLRIIFPL